MPNVRPELKSETTFYLLMLSQHNVLDFTRKKRHVRRYEMFIVTARCRAPESGSLSAVSNLETTCDNESRRRRRGV